MAKKTATENEPKTKKPATEKQLAARAKFAQAAKDKAAAKASKGTPPVPAAEGKPQPGSETETVALPEIDETLYALVVPEGVPFVAIAINLDASADRRAYIVDHLQHIGLTFCLQQAKPAEEDTDASRLLASLHSHLRVLEQIEDSELQLPVIVLEDDVHLHDGFYHHAKAALQQLPEEWDVAFLGYLQHGDETASVNTGKWKQFVKPNFAGAYCYAINGKAAAAKVLAAAPEDFKEGMDTLLLRMIEEGKVNAWFLNQQLGHHTSGLPTTIWQNLQ